MAAWSEYITLNRVKIKIKCDTDEIYQRIHQAMDGGKQLQGLNVRDYKEVVLA